MLIRPSALLLGVVTVACLSACDMRASVEDSFVCSSTRSELGCSLTNDMGDMTTPSKCAAAQGLSGDILSDLCLDLDKIDSQGLIGRGFNLTSATMNCAGWEVAAGKLQPKSINTPAGTVSCGLSLPNIPVPAKYSRVTLALIHKATLPSANQQARMELFDISNPLRIWVNPSTALDQRTMVGIDSVNIPGGSNAQPTLQLLAPMGSATPTWTIRSIAVLGNQ